MAEIERRRDNAQITDVRIAVARIEVSLGTQSDAIRRIETRLEVAVLRDEFDAHVRDTNEKYLKLSAAQDNLWNAYQQKLGSDSTWRLLYAGALALLTLAVTIYGVLVASGTIK